MQDLLAELQSTSPYSCRCAVDLARRVSAHEPGILHKYADLLIKLAGELPAEQWQARGYVAMAAALNASTRAQRMRLAVLVRALAADERNALRTIALEALATLAVAEPELREEAMLLLERSRRNGTTAMRMRARRMLLVLMTAEERNLKCCG